MAEKEQVQEKLALIKAFWEDNKCSNCAQVEDDDEFG